ncbi:Tetratricopeptide repeat containing protein [Gracilaria domingensis]|nr:Tetratricopeptide repeat containing protein [Gracilaria domingensis]
MAPVHHDTHLSLAAFERALLTGDVNALHAIRPDAAAIVAGDYNLFLSRITPHHTPESHQDLSVAITAECVQGAAQVTMRSDNLKNALIEAANGNVLSLISAYLAGVALLQAFARENWAGPISKTASAVQSETASFFLVLDGEDVAIPAKCLHWLRAARFILVEHVQQFVSCGATLAPWWAARVLFAHQSVLANPTPTLQYALFRMYGRFLGKQVADMCYRFDDSDDANPPHEGTQEEEHEADDFDLLPAPVADGNDTIADEDDDFAQVLDVHDAHDRQLMALAYIELAHVQRLFYDGDGALSSLKAAGKLDRVTFRLTGEMGVRTKHQSKPTAQLIARAFILNEPSDTFVDDSGKSTFCFKFPADVERAENGANGSAIWPINTSLPLPKNIQVCDEDVLGFVKLTSSDELLSEAISAKIEVDDSDEEASNPETIGAEVRNLTPLQQALALCHASVIRARNASHILTKEQMSPFVSLVLEGAKSPYGTSSVLQLRALMLRVGLEGERGRFLERCMQQMEEVGRFVDDPLESLDISLKHSAAAERTVFLYGSSLPPRWELKKELAISFGRIGLVRSAMEIFEELEFWDELVDCHRLIGNLGAAEDLVRKELDRLDKAVLDEGISDDATSDQSFMKGASARAVRTRAARRPRLLCVLGDVTRNREHFETAWEESGHRYARAKRALGMMCIEAEQWESAMGHYKQALAINSLFPEAWFVYGCAAIQTGEIQTAAHAFTRVIQQAPENAEAWNNLARVLHELGKKKEALKALTEAGKLMRDSWRIWNNVLLLATELLACPEILRAMDRLMDIRGKEGVSAQSIGVVVAEVIRMSGSSDPEDKAAVGPVSRKLLKVLARCSSLVSTNPSVWAAYAQLYELLPSNEDKQRAFECRLKQVRSLVAQGEWKTELTALRHMAIACDALGVNALSTKNTLSIRAAKIQTRSVVEQTRQDYHDCDAFQRLVEIQNSLEEACDPVCSP